MTKDTLEEVRRSLGLLHVEHCEEDEVRIAALQRLHQRSLLLLHADQQRHLLPCLGLVVQQQVGQLRPLLCVCRRRHLRQGDVPRRGEPCEDRVVELLVRQVSSSSDHLACPVDEDLSLLQPHVLADLQRKVVLLPLCQPEHEGLRGEALQLGEGEGEANTGLSDHVEHAERREHVHHPGRPVRLKEAGAVAGCLEQLLLQLDAELVRGGIKAHGDRLWQRVSDPPYVLVRLRVVLLQQLQGVEENGAWGAGADLEDVNDAVRDAMEELAAGGGDDPHSVHLREEEHGLVVGVFHPVPVRSDHEHDLVPVEHHGVCAAPDQLQRRHLALGREL
mmetsp:Transcript_49877/g.156097  ORF Transcript_49877/g.156097 Transcript_49877/m.156097 type:complete len:333 (-) Transcript_49877:928-1926(-)